MAKGKGGSGKTYVSKGERKSSMKTATRDPAQRIMDQLKALSKGKNVIFSLPETQQVYNKDGKQRVVMVKTKVNGKDWLKNRLGPSEKATAE